MVWSPCLFSFSVRIDAVLNSDHEQVLLTHRTMLLEF